MCEPHQLFVIAKINGCYRTLCAIHHRSLYGYEALRRCLVTLNIFADPANRIPLEQELIAAQRHDEEFWTANTDDEYYGKNGHVPFPFIATCLITGASFGPDDGYYHAVWIEPFYMAYDEGDNSDGITLFDISEPSNVRYCFVDFHGIGSTRPVPLMTPLTARVYLEAYYTPSEFESLESLPPLLDKFNGLDTIPVATLQDTWPEGEWQELEPNHGGSDEMAVPELKKIEGISPDSSKSLRDRAMATVFQSLLDGTDDNTGVLSEAEVLTDFLPKLKEKLYEHANALKPSRHLMNILCRALEDEVDVDPSPFQGFSAEDLSFVVSRLRNNGKMNTLCMSSRPNLTEEDLQVVLRGAAGLKTLYILECPQIPMQRMDTLLDDCHVFHSDLFRRPIMPHPERAYPVLNAGTSNDVIPASQTCGGNGLSQLVWIGVSEGQVRAKEYHLDNGLIDWQSLRREKGSGGPEFYESYLRYKRHTLDIPLPTFKTVDGLLRLLRWGSSSDLLRCTRDAILRAAAFSFAMASSIPLSNDLEVGSLGSNGFGIGPLPKSLYLDSIYDHRPPTDDHGHLELGHWAIILIHEAFDAEDQEEIDHHMQREHNQDSSFQVIKRMRYALVTPSIKRNLAGRDFIVADIPAYVKHVRSKAQDKDKGKDGELQKLIKAWNTSIAAMDAVDFYGDGDIHDILSKVFPNQEATQQGSNPD